MVVVVIVAAVIVVVVVASPSVDGWWREVAAAVDYPCGHGRCCRRRCCYVYICRRRSRGRSRLHRWWMHSGVWTDAGVRWPLLLFVRVVVMVAAVVVVVVAVVV